MRKILFCIAFLFTLISVQRVNAQSIAGRFRMMKTSWEVDKKKVLTELMQFDAAEAHDFWPAYDKYMKNWSRLMNYRIYTIEKYCDDISNMTNSRMAQFMDELLVSDVELNKLQKKTYKKVRKILTPVRASQFMQMEYAFQLVLLSEMQQRAMFLGDATRKL